MQRLSAASTKIKIKAGGASLRWTAEGGCPHVVRGGTPLLGGIAVPDLLFGEDRFRGFLKWNLVGPIRDGPLQGSNSLAPVLRRRSELGR